MTHQDQPQPGALLPCPWPGCGKPAGGMPGVYATCSDPMCPASTLRMNAEAWNRRPSAVPTEAQPVAWLVRGPYEKSAFAYKESEDGAWVILSDVLAAPTVMGLTPKEQEAMDTILARAEKRSLEPGFPYEAKIVALALRRLSASTEGMK